MLCLCLSFSCIRSSLHPEYNLLARSPIQFWNLFVGCFQRERASVGCMRAASQIHSGKLKARFVSCCRQVGSGKGRKEGREGDHAAEVDCQPSSVRGNKLCLIIRVGCWGHGTTFDCRWQNSPLKTSSTFFFPFARRLWHQLRVCRHLTPATDHK